MSLSTLKMIYHSLFYSVMSYSIMFWGKSPHSPVIFQMQKRVIRILMGIGYRESCRGLFKDLKILPLRTQYILSLLLFVVLNKGYFSPNSIYHNFNTRQKNDLHLPYLSLTMYQRGVFYSGIKVFNALPLAIKDISGNPKKFKVALKHYQLNSFYNLDEFFNEQNYNKSNQIKLRPLWSYSSQCHFILPTLPKHNHL